MKCKFDKDLDSKQTDINKLRRIAQFVLFITSYTPLFLLICLKQIHSNKEFITWGSFTHESILIYFQKFGLSTFLLIISLSGLIGSFFLFKNIEEHAKNGDNVTIKDVNNRNNESIGYIATYIVPFLFQSFSNWYEIVAFSFLMIIIYRIYINSNLIIINPLLSFRYSIFQLEYESANRKIRNGLIITKEKVLNEDAIIKIYPIGHKLFYARLRKN